MWYTIQKVSQLWPHHKINEKESYRLVIVFNVIIHIKMELVIFVLAVIVVIEILLLVLTIFWGPFRRSYNMQLFSQFCCDTSRKRICVSMSIKVYSAKKTRKLLKSCNNLL